MDKIIECDKITHYYGNRLIYKDLSFEVEKGKVLGLLGKNGTGKTTIINILNGYLKPRSGVCRLFSEEMEHLTPQTKARIGLLLEGHVQAVSTVMFICSLLRRHSYATTISPAH